MKLSEENLHSLSEERLVKRTELIVAEMLDVQSFDAENIVTNTIKEIKQKK